MRGLRTGRLTTVIIAVTIVLVAAGALSSGDPSGGSDAARSSASSNAPASSTTRSTTPEPPTTTATPTPTPTPAAADVTTTSGGPPGPRGAAPVDQLVVAAPDAALAPYRRKMFGNGWDYDPATNCNTRERVLIEESLVAAVVGAKCRPTGRWQSAYDGVITTDIADLEIDHLVPLADAWRSGAATWTSQQRETYANDLTDPNTLLAVTSHTNRSKSDSTPDKWMPPDRSNWCTYASEWVEIKGRWHLTVTAAEKATLVQVLQGCGA